METTAVTPVAPPPAPEAQPPRDTKEEEGSEKAKGFEKALKKEIALLAPDAAVVEADPAADAALLAVTDALAPADTAVPVDPAVVALVTDPALQPQAAGAAAAAAALLAAANAASARDMAGDRSGVRGGTEAVATERPVTERVAPEANIIERGAIERDAAERGAVHRVMAGRDMRERIAGEIVEARLAQEPVEGELTGRDAVTPEGKRDTPLAAFGERAGLPPMIGQQAPPAGVPLDGLSSASLVAKWSPAAQAAFDTAATSASARIDTPLGTSGWGDAFQQKVIWLVDRQQQRAELHINPPHLGPVEIMLNLSDDSARIAFCSPHAAVREAIEASLPDLQTALNQRGLELGQATVSADAGAAREQMSQEANNSSARDGAARHARGPAGSTAGPLAIDTPRRVVATQGLVDTFA